MSPRLHSYRERLYANIYDCAALDDGQDWRHIFGNSNVGDQFRTNLQVAGQIGFDQTFVICNIYARTNVRCTPMSDADREVARDMFLEGRDDEGLLLMLQAGDWERSPLTRAFDEWAHSCRARLVVGQKPMFELNVHDLMGGPAFSGSPTPPAADDDMPPGPPAWRRHIARAIIVPVRQNLHVELTAHPSAGEAFRRALANAPTMATKPLLWIHLEGLLSRDVG